MKKILLTVAALAFSAALVSAQDINAITEIYNNGANALSSGEKTEALKNFKDAFAQAVALGEEGAEIASNCKGVIPSIQLSIAKDLIKAANYDEAVASLEEAIKIAGEYEAADVIDEATTLIPQVFNQKGADLLKEKNYAGAAEAFKKVVELDPENGAAFLRLGQALSNDGATEDAIAAFEKASEFGQQANAVKQLANIYLKKAQAFIKEKNFKEGLEAAVKSGEYVESANAFKLAASAATSLKDNATAIANYEKYLGISPDAKDANAIAFTIAALYQQAGNKAKALEFYTKVAGDATYGAQAKQLIEALNK